jgi:4'-phosphopantetheinyl transferase EntD
MKAGTERIAEVEAALRALFPDGVAWSCCDDRGPVPPLLGAESEATARAVDKRRFEFARGRQCAREALARLGCAPQPIAAGDDRAPRWPTGYVGSITHCSGLVAAAAAHSNQLRSVAIDAEPAEPLASDLAARICTPAEMRRSETRPGADAAHWNKRVFGAKECVHKCVAPLTGVTLDFHDVEIEFGQDAEFEQDASVFRVHPLTERALAQPVQAIEGHFADAGGWMLVGAWIAVD